ncbi:MAG: thioredoxin [Lachnospiraceae bacterium]|nr:thioredoxin [Lachnospiraceae bacterium]
MAVIHIKEDEFEEKVLKNDKPAFVDFYATWCGPCKMMAPILEEISEENPDVDFFAIDTEEAETVSAKYGVMSIPNMILFKNGEVADRILGKQPKQIIVDFIKK